MIFYRLICNNVIELLLAKQKQGFPKDCHWSKAKWERCLKKVEKKQSDVNKYAICNAQCLGTTDH